MIHQGFLKIRILLIFFLAIFFFLFIVGRALQLQLIPNSKLAQLARRQYQTAITLFPKRGKILDRKKNELAVSRKVGSIYANPRKIKYKKRTAKNLSRLTGVPYQRIYKKLRSKKSFVWIKRLARDSLTMRLQKKPIHGVGIIYEYKRFYPNQEVAGQVLGAVGVDSQGVEGLEYSFNKQLYGKKQSIALIRDARGRPITFDKTLFTETQEGDSLVLTIDKSVQFLIERELELAVEKFGAKNGLALIQNSETGEILVMAHYPFFNPNKGISYKGSLWKNRAVTDLFEPGSIFKIILSAVALENGVRPDARFFCENGIYKVGRRAVIREAQNHKYGWLTFRNILKFSSNIGSVKIAERLGKKVYHQQILDFGFGEKTGVGAPGEAAGKVRSVKTWTPVDLSNIAFGQGISVTAIQMITAISAIANGGKLMKPMLVRERIDAKTGVVSLIQPMEIGQVISPAAASQLTDMMVRVTETRGTGILARLDGYSVAGKTGTAQKPNLKRGGYWADKYVSSFVGFFPADQPKYTILVVIDEPKDKYYASQVAAPLFKAAALHTLQFYPLETMTAKEPVIVEKGSASLRRFTRTAPVTLQAEDDRMPDLRGHSMRDVLIFGSKAGLNMRVKGSGIVVSQSLKPGTLIQPGQKCIVSFRAPSR